MPHVVFGGYQPQALIMSTPNYEFNAFKSESQTAARSFWKLLSCLAVWQPFSLTATSSSSTIKRAPLLLQKRPGDRQVSTPWRVTPKLSKGYSSLANKRPEIRILKTSIQVSIPPRPWTVPVKGLLREQMQRLDEMNEWKLHCAASVV